MFVKSQSISSTASFLHFALLVGILGEGRGDMPEPLYTYVWEHVIQAKKVRFNLKFPDLDVPPNDVIFLARNRPVIKQSLFQ